MTNKRIQELKNFFYSSDSSRVVPLRISASMGMAGFDLTPDAFVTLLKILNNSKNLKKDLTNFVNQYGS